MQFAQTFVWIFILDLFYAGPILLILVFLIILVGHSIAKIEGWSNMDGIYHGFINATTVGYGDLRPTKSITKLLSIVMAIIGLIFTGLMVAIAVHAANLAFSELY